MQSFSPLFLKTVVILANFHMCGKYDDCSDLLNSLESITKFQSRFRPGDSTVNQLISISNDFGKAIDDGKEIRIQNVILCDISKAFDLVNTFE
jgi:hypothetical protein